jgi:hypothetical protein
MPVGVRIGPLEKREKNKLVNSHKYMIKTVSIAYHFIAHIHIFQVSSVDNVTSLPFLGRQYACT